MLFLSFPFENMIFTSRLLLRTFCLTILLFNSQKRFRSLTEIQEFSRSDIRIPLFDKESSDFCFQKSHEILSRPFVGMQAAGVDDTPKTTKSLDGDRLSENIIDIESTLKAINLDFMKTYNELDKADSAETLLNEKLSSIVTSLEDEINSATGSHRSPGGLFYEQGTHTHTKFDFSAASNHLDRHLQFMKSPSTNSAHFDAVHENKIADDKRSTTPDTGFASRDTNLSLSRRSSQKSNYSPQETLFNSKDTQFGGHFSYMGLKNETPFYSFEQTTEKKPPKYMKNSETATAIATTVPKTRNTAMFANNRVGGTHPQRVGAEPFGEIKHRQRSMSFTDNSYDMADSMAMDRPANHRKLQRSSAFLPQTAVASFQCTTPRTVNSKSVIRPRHVYKPRSIRARTMRRLSYNPIILDTSSSSAEGSDCDRSTARSECDIRSHTSKASRRRGHYFNRKALSASQDGRDMRHAKEKLYGSNASVRSAPHYNYDGFRNQPASERYHKVYDEAPARNGAYGVERIYDFGGPGPGNNYAVAAGNNLIRPPKAFAVNTVYNRSGSGSSSAASSTAANSGSACSYVYEFDVSKLTGKSPTSNNFTNSSPEDKMSTSKPPATSLPLPLARNASARTFHVNSSQTQSSDFHWPEKIHASSVQQSDFLWHQQHRRAATTKRGGPFETRRLSTEQRNYSTDTSSSSTNSEEFEFRRDFLPHVPPSPAP